MMLTIRICTCIMFIVVVAMGYMTVGAYIDRLQAQDEARSARTSLEGYKRTLGHVDSAFNCREKATVTK